VRKVAIIGRCYSTRSDAPWDNKEWELWTLAWDPVPVTHRMFETHKNFRMYLGSQEEGDFHVGGLRMAKVPVVMLEKHDDIPMSVRFPMEEVTALIGKTNKGTPYLESSIAYMMAQAILELTPGDRIGIWGVDLHCDSEYAFQRPNLEYLIGLARGKGIKVYIPPQSALLTHQMGVPYGFYSSTDVGAPATPLPQGKAA
jgi:hypothetical protein